MSNPYAPPSTKEDIPPTPSNTDTILRRVGALALIYQAQRIAWNNFTSLDTQSLRQAILGTSAGAALMGLLIYGFLWKGRKSHGGIALYLALYMIGQALLTNMFAFDAYIMGHTFPKNPWLDLAIRIAPHAIAFICATALYIRARRTTPTAA